LADIEAGLYDKDYFSSPAQNNQEAVDRVHQAFN
jgi:hypothetical protein